MNSKEPLDSPLRPIQTGGNRPGRIGRLALKELRETLRDRRTIVTLVLMPLIVYPMLSLAFQKFLLTGAAGTSQLSEYRIGFESDADGQLVRSAMQRGLISIQRREERAQRERVDSKATEAESGEKPDPPTKTDAPKMDFFVLDDIARGVASNTVDVAVRLKQKEPLRISGVLDSGFDCELLYFEASPRSREAVAIIERMLSAINADAYRQQLRGMGVAGRITAVRADRQAVEIHGVSTAPTSTLATLVPLILILMTITGAVYPAIDLTAGERERGTLEMLIAAPVPRLQLLLAKYVAVVTVALLTATINLVSMMATVSSMGLSKLLFGEAGLSFLMIVQIFALLVIFAAFFAAVLLAVTSFARSFKEAQAYLIPLMLVSMAPGLLSMIPGLSLNGPLAVTPLINMVLLARDLFAGTVSPMIVVVVVGTTALFALAAIGVASRVFGTDAILYGSEGAWSDLFRRPARSATVASFTSAIFCLALMFPGNFLAANVIARSSDLPVSYRLMLTSVMTVILFAGLPLAVARWLRVSIRDGFRIKPAPALAFLAAAILGVSLWSFAHEVVVVQRVLGFVTLTEEQIARGQKLIEEIVKLPPIVLVLALGIVPAVCEEFFFRGYLLSALSTRLKAREAILLSGIMFGLFHVLTDRLAVERLLPSTLMGFVLGWVFVRTGSVLPGMLLHAAHNSLLVLAARYQEQVAPWLGLDREADLENSHLPVAWLIGAGVVVAVGFGLMIASTRERPEGPAELESVAVAQ